MDYVGRKAKDLAEMLVEDHKHEKSIKALSGWYDAFGQNMAYPTAAADRYDWPGSSH